MEDGPTLYYRLILEGMADPDRCALDMECIDAVRAALDEIDRLQERVYALEAEVMQTGGELVIETGKRMAAERGRDEALGGMVTLAKANAECRMALGSILKCWPLDDPYLREAIRRGQEVYDRFRPDTDAVHRVLDELESAR